MMPFVSLLASGTDRVMANVSTLDPASPSAESIRFLFIFVTAASIFVLAVVWGVLFYSLARFRRGRGVADSRPAKEPPQVYGSMPIEIAWTVAPGLIVFLLALVIVRTEFEVRVTPQRQPENAQITRAKVVGHQWWWEYVVEHHDREAASVITANELHVPASTPDVPRPVYLNLQAADVCHSFWVPRLAGKTDLIPGRVNEMWFQTAEIGLFVGQCAEYCGAQHANMLLRVYVDSPEDYSAWLANEAQDAVDDASQREGRDVFLAQSCVNCHTIRGTAARGKFGPDLTHFASRKTLASGMIELNRENLRRWIRDPQEVKPGCLMPAFGLGDREVSAITDYLMSLR